MLPMEIKKDIFWVGAVDFNSRDFHGYTLSPDGTTSNAYVIKDEKTVLFDTVKDTFGGSFLSRLSHVTKLEDIDYIVVNHVELDHAGMLPELIQRCKPEKVFCSPMGLKALHGHFDCEGWPLHVVKTGDSISIGKRTIHFIETRMLHWPDSMFSYIPEDKLLISNDAFGQNIASIGRFTDEISREALDNSVTLYYNNIILPFSSQVLSVFDHISALKLDIDMIAPDHGLIFRKKEDIEYILGRYKELALQKPQKRAVIFYDTMWHSTEKMAYAIAEGLQTTGISSCLLQLTINHESRVMLELASSGLVVCGSPTHNNGIMSSVAATLNYMKGLRPKNRMAAAFGSYGWSGESTKVISESFAEMGMTMPVDSLKVHYVPKHDAMRQCIAMGQQLGEALITFCDEV